ncbi:MAG: cell division protein SepF [Oscillospiraceae bacterium]|nr:cell division protein SepF [Oscillospiraceae bacterium]
MGNFFKNIFGTGDENEGFVDYEENSGSYDTTSNAVTNEEAGFSDYSSSKSDSYGSSSKYINLHSAGIPKLTILKPKSYEEVMSDAVELLREGTIIILNLNDISSDISMRIVDFMTGVTAAFEGRIKRIEAFCYAAAPKNVDWINNIED